jgi:hypothetical protein
LGNRYGALWLPAALVGAWLIAQAVWALPAEITDDWLGWRQADTQSIAVNFIQHGDGILHPRINWGGDGPGHVETEFQLYTYIAASVMRVVGIGERPGLWISLLAMAAAALVLHDTLRRRLGDLPALLGLATFLSLRGPVFLSSTVQPDALSFLFYCLSFAALLAYLDAPSRRTLAAMAASTVLAALVKATALHIGLFQVLAIVLCRPGLLRRPDLWLAWTATLAVVGLFLLHGQQLYLEYGNTFGVINGGDSKFATFETLLMPELYPPLARLAVVWGLGWPGAAAAVYLLAVRRLDRTAVALGLADLTYLLVAFRYTCNEWNGPHYHLFTSVLGVWLMAHAAHHLLERFSGRRWSRSLAAAVLAVCLAFYVHQIHKRHDPGLVLWEKNPAVAMGKALRELADPGSLVIVRSSALARDSLFDTPNNFEDPRVFYLAKVRGWVLPADEVRLDVIRDALEAGAAYYVDPYRKRNAPELDAWLADNAELAVDRGELGRIYKLRAPGGLGGEGF